MEFVKNIPAHLDKHCGNRELIALRNAYVRNLGAAWGGCLQARYYKGVAGDGDNLVIVQNRRRK